MLTGGIQERVVHQVIARSRSCSASGMETDPAIAGLPVHTTASSVPGARSKVQCERVAGACCARCLRLCEDERCLTR